MDIQQKIRQLMLERRWTSYQLSKKADISQTTISNIFKRNNAPTFHTLSAICEACGITLSQFFSEENDPIILTDNQKTILTKWSTLTEKQKNILLDLIDNISPTD